MKRSVVAKGSSVKNLVLVLILVFLLALLIWSLSNNKSFSPPSEERWASTDIRADNPIDFLTQFAINNQLVSGTIQMASIHEFDGENHLRLEQSEPSSLMTPIEKNIFESRINDLIEGSQPFELIINEGLDSEQSMLFRTRMMDPIYNQFFSFDPKSATIGGRKGECHIKWQEVYAIECNGDSKTWTTIVDEKGGSCDPDSYAREQCIDFARQVDKETTAFFFSLNPGCRIITSTPQQIKHDPCNVAA